MTPLLTRLNRGSKKLLAYSRAKHDKPLQKPLQKHIQKHIQKHNLKHNQQSNRETNTQASKKPPTKASFSARIELIPSRMHRAVHLSITTLALLAPINIELPGAVIALVWAWALGSAYQSYRHPQRITELRDEGETWLLISPTRADRVWFKNTDYRNAYVIIIAFTTRSGVIRRVCIWRDAVTHSAFSWISARTGLGGADRQVKTMATSSTQRCFFHPLEVKQ